MAANPESRLVIELSKATGQSEQIVGQTLKALAQIAYREARSGFVLPGFGGFRVVEREDLTATNPFTGEPTKFKQPPEVEFTLDTDAKKAFLANQTQETSALPSVASEEVVLNELRLAAYRKDVERLGLDIEHARQARCKLGGKPEWMQADETPVCCGQSMLFVAQLDCSFGEAFSGDHYLEYFYLFLCLECHSPKAIYQIT